MVQGLEGLGSGEPQKLTPPPIKKHRITIIIVTIVIKQTTNKEQKRGGPYPSLSRAAGERDANPALLGPGSCTLGASGFTLLPFGLHKKSILKTHPRS